MIVCMDRALIPYFMFPLTESFRTISVSRVASFSSTTTVFPEGSTKAADVSIGQPAVRHMSATLDLTSPERERDNGRI